MRTTMRNFTRVDWLRTRFASGAILLFGFIPLSGFALVQTSGPDNVSHVRTASAATRRSRSQTSTENLQL